MGTYVEDYLESMYLLPSEIKRNFDLMRDLDKVRLPLLAPLSPSTPPPNASASYRHPTRS